MRRRDEDAVTNVVNHAGWLSEMEQFDLVLSGGQALAGFVRVRPSSLLSLTTITTVPAQGGY